MCIIYQTVWPLFLWSISCKTLRNVEKIMAYLTQNTGILNPEMSWRPCCKFTIKHVIVQWSHFLVQPWICIFNGVIIPVGPNKVRADCFLVNYPRGGLWWAGFPQAFPQVFTRFALTHTLRASAREREVYGFQSLHHHPRADILYFKKLAKDSAQYVFFPPCCTACWILVPWWRMNLCPWQWKCGVLTTEPPENLLYVFLIRSVFKRERTWHL